MAGLRLRITNASVKGAPVGVLIWDTDLAGFMARKAASGLVTFSFNWRDKQTGKTVRRKIGSADVMPATQARTIAAEWRLLVQTTGTVPGHGTTDQGGETFGELATRWLEMVAAEKAEATHRLYSSVLRNYVFSTALAEKPVASVSRADLVAVIDATKKRSKSTAIMLFRILSAFLSWADARGHMVGVTLPKARLVVSAPRQRKRVLSMEEIVHLWQWSADIRPLSRDALRLLLLTGLRSGSVLSVLGQNVKPTGDGGATVLIEAAAMKSGKAFEVPLTAWAVSQLPLLQSPNRGPVFGLSKARLGSTLAKYKREHEAAEDIRFHDIRRSIRTFAAENGFGREAGERALAHEVAMSAVEKTYNRADYSRAGWPVLTAWQNHIRGELDPQDNVIPMEGRKWT